MTTPYSDTRSAFWREHWERAARYDAYLAGSDARYRARWDAAAAALPGLDENARARLALPRRRLQVLVSSGAWCGDCVRQGPMIEACARAAADTEVRWLDRDEAPSVAEELRIMGALRVPVAVFLSEDFWEVGRWGDRTLSAYRAKARRELGAACDTGIVPPPPDELADELAEWVDVFERMLWIVRLSPPLRERHGD